MAITCLNNHIIALNLEPEPDWTVHLFETCRIVGTEVPLFDFHYDRLRESAVSLNLPLPPELEICKDLIQQFISHHDVTRTGLKVLLGSTPADEPCFKLIERPFLALSPADMATGVSVGIASEKRDTTDGTFTHKHFSRDWAVAIMENKQNHFDMLILNDRDELCEGAITNIFLCKGEQILSPALESNLLPGVMRAYIIQSLAEGQTPVQEQTLTLEDLFNADDVFLANALRGLIPVSQVEEKQLASKLSPAAKALMEVQANLWT